MHLQIAADDRTGALEVAAAIADRTGRPVPVAVWPDISSPDDSVSVIDLESRHLDPSAAVGRVAMLRSESAGHKIDSTLRGNWASELATRHHTSGSPVLVVPSLPSLGRTCVDGVVLLDGVPVHESAAGRDARFPVSSSRPAELLDIAGISAIELGSALQAERWCRDPSGVAVVDAADEMTIEHIVDAWRSTSGVILAGTSVVMGYAVADERPLPIALAGPLLLVVGSLHPLARRQVATAVDAGLLTVADSPLDAATTLTAGHHAVIATTFVAGAVEGSAAADAARRLAASVVEILDHVRPGALVVLGGDTAAAVLGDRPVSVLGSLSPGTAVVDSPTWEVPIVTRAGGFGGDAALVELLWGTLPE